MSGRNQERTVSGFGDDIDPFALGENPSHDHDSMAQYRLGLMSVGLRNELIKNYSGADVFKFIENSMVDEIKNHPGRPARVLTVGAGSGEIEYRVARATQYYRHRPQILASDLYPHFHGYQRQAKKGGLAELEYMSLDARHLPFADNSLDFVCAPFVLYHINSDSGGPEHAVEEILRVLQPGGKALFGVRGPGHMRQIWEEWLPLISSELSQESLIDYKSPPSWYPNCDLGRTGWLLDKTFGNKRTTFRQVSPESFINIPGNETGWQDLAYVLKIFKDNFRPVPPDIPRFSQIVETKIKADFYRRAEQNGGFFPMDIEQAVFEAIKVA